MLSDVPIHFETREWAPLFWNSFPELEEEVIIFIPSKILICPAKLYLICDELYFWAEYEGRMELIPHWEVTLWKKIKEKK